MHASILIQFTDPADGYAAQTTAKTGRVSGYWSMTRKGVVRIISSNGTKNQGAVLHCFGHGSGSVQIPAHGGHAITTHPGEGWTQAHSTAVGCWPASGTPGVLSHRSSTEMRGERDARTRTRLPRRAFEIPWVPRGAPWGGLRPSHGEFTQAELAQQDSASLLQTCDHSGVDLRYEVSIHTQ